MVMLLLLLVLIGCLHVSGSLDVSISIDPPRYSANMTDTISIVMTGLFPGVEPSHIAWSTGARTIYQWQTYPGGLIYDEEWPWSNHHPPPPVPRESWHIITFQATRCDGVFMEQEASNTVRRDGRLTAYQTTSSMASGIYTLHVSAPSATPGALPDTGTHVKPLPVDMKVGDVDFSVFYQGQVEPIYNSYHRPSHQYYHRPTSNQYNPYRSGVGYTYNRYRPNKNRRSPVLKRQIFENVNSMRPITAKCELSEFYPAPRAELLVNGKVVARRAERYFLRNDFCLHSGEIELSTPVTVQDDAVEITCLIHLGTKQVKRIIELRPNGYEPPTDITTVEDTTIASTIPPTSDTSLSPPKASKMAQTVCNVGGLWGCIERTSPVAEHVNQTCDTPYYCLNPVNSRLAEVTSCLELLEVCYASSRVNFDRAELQKVDLYRMEGMIVQEDCQTKKQTCFLGKEEVEHSKFPVAAMSIVIILMVLLVTTAIFLCVAARVYKSYHRKLYDVSSILLPWPGKRIYKPTPTSASSI